MNGPLKIGSGLMALYMLLSAISFLVAPSRFPGTDAAAQQRYAQSVSASRTLKGIGTAALFGGLIFLGIGWMQRKKGK